MVQTKGFRALPGALPGLLLVVGIACAGVSAPPPDWVQAGGSSDAFPPDRFVTGFADVRSTEHGLEHARQQAAADLSRQISLQIESVVVDVTHERDGQLSNDLTSRIRTTTDIQLEGVAFETWSERGRVRALAVLERRPAAAASRRQRDRALDRTRRCLDDAAQEEAAGRASRALAAYRDCRTALHEAVEREAVASALLRGGLLEDEGGGRIVEYATWIERRSRAIPHEDARSIRAAAEALAIQLARGGVGRGSRLQVAPFLYRDRDVSSPFGREVALALESAIGRDRPAERSASDGIGIEAVVVRGHYHESEDTLHLRATAREAGTARLLASAEIDLARAAVPADLAIAPANFEAFARDADKLAGGDVVSGDLRLELRTDRGSRGLVYDEGDELGIFFRVNQPAWVRLIYALTNGELVPIDQGYFVDETKVNRLVEYPERFEIVAPFGVEMIHAMAYTQRPAPLRTRPTRIEGQAYRVLTDGADQVVRQRGIARRARLQVAEQTVHLTTMPRDPR